MALHLPMLQDDDSPHREAAPTKTINLVRTTPEEREEWAREVAEVGPYERPRTRGDCANVPRPCPFVSCRHHLYLEVHQSTGSLIIPSSGVEPGDMPADASCSLDVAEQGGLTLDEVGGHFAVSRERVRQVETHALRILKMNAPSLAGVAFTHSVDRWGDRHDTGNRGETPETTASVEYGRGSDLDTTQVAAARTVDYYDRRVRDQMLIPFVREMAEREANGETTSSLTRKLEVNERRTIERHGSFAAYLAALEWTPAPLSARLAADSLRHEEERCAAGRYIAGRAHVQAPTGFGEGLLVIGERVDVDQHPRDEGDALIWEETDGVEWRVGAPGDLVEATASEVAQLPLFEPSSTRAPTFEKHVFDTLLGLCRKEKRGVSIKRLRDALQSNAAVNLFRTLTKLREQGLVTKDRNNGSYRVADTAWVDVHGEREAKLAASRTRREAAAAERKQRSDEHHARVLAKRERKEKASAAAPAIKTRDLKRKLASMARRCARIERNATEANSHVSPSLATIASLLPQFGVSK